MPKIRIIHRTFEIPVRRMRSAPVMFVFDNTLQYATEATAVNISADIARSTLAPARIARICCMRVGDRLVAPKRPSRAGLLCFRRHEPKEVSLTQAIGFLAGLFASRAFVPHVVLCVADTIDRDLSLLTIVALTTGVTPWIIYGVLIRSLPKLSETF